MKNRKELTKEQVIEIWRNNNYTIFEYGIKTDKHTADIQILYYDEVGYLRKIIKSISVAYVPVVFYVEWDKDYRIYLSTSSADELREKLISLMKTVMPENAVSKMKEQLVLEGEFFSSIGWGNVKSFLNSRVIRSHVLCKMFSCKDCPMGKYKREYEGCCTKKWFKFRDNPSSKSFAAYKKQVDALLEQPKIKVEAGQVWKHISGDLYAVLQSTDSEYAVTRVSRQQANSQHCARYCDAASLGRLNEIFIACGSLTLTDLQVVTIRPGEEFVKRQK